VHIFGNKMEGSMRVEVMQHFGLTMAFNQAGYHETEHHKELTRDIRGAIGEGRLVVRSINMKIN
jgi:type II secretory pathway predicted ATPase ExeA